MNNTINVVFTADEASTYGVALTERLRSTVGASRVRCSPVVDSWDGLTDVCRGADIVYLLSALDLPDSPDLATLRKFRTGVSRVLECCQECGVSSLVFMSSSRVVPSHRDDDKRREDSGRSGWGRSRSSSGSGSGSRTGSGGSILGVMRDAEAEVLKASETQNLGKGVLFTCALRPGIIYGTGNDQALLRALSWVGWGMNRVTLRGLPESRSDLVFFQNLIEATVLAGTKLAEGAAGAQAGGARWSTRAGPTCSGQAYFITDEQPTNFQSLLDGVFEGLDFTTSKVLRLPVAFALVVGWAAEHACKLMKTPPIITRSEIRKLVEDRCSSNERARKDLGYEPRVDGQMALRMIVESLKSDGWGRHTLLVPGLGYWICIPIGIWLTTIAAFGALCPAFLAPVQQFALYLHLAVFRRLWVVRLVWITTVLAHVLEGWYAFSLAKRADHGDTAPLWLFQTVILGYPSTRLVMQLLS
ncbi:unnamed protein product [Scytosiphon promiscuus]